MPSIRTLVKTLGAATAVTGAVTFALTTSAHADTSADITPRGGEAGDNQSGDISLINPQGSDSFLEIDKVLSNINVLSNFTLIDLGD